MSRFVALLLFVAASAATAFPAHAERLWLVIGASDATPAGIAQKAKTLAKGEGLIVQTVDCGDRRSIFAWAAGVEASSKAAEALLPKVRQRAPDAYVKRCEAKAGSLLSYRVPAVDPSIADVPDTAVNWHDADRLATIHPLPAGRALVFAPYFERQHDDPLEGRRVRVLLVDRAGSSRELEKHCFRASSATAANGYFAFQCAREQAGEQIFHSVLLFDGDGGKVKEFSRCRKPRFAAGYLYCEAESIKADGSLGLRTVKYRYRK